MRTITDNQYKAFSEHRKIGQRMRELEKEKKEFKKKCLSIFGKAKSLKTKHGSILSLETKEVAERITTVEAYSYDIIKET